jgi:hypothetical protein
MNLSIFENLILKNINLVNKISYLFRKSQGIPHVSGG